MEERFNMMQFSLYLNLKFSYPLQSFGFRKKLTAPKPILTVIKTVDIFREAFGMRFYNSFEKMDHQIFETEEQFLTYAVPRCLKLVDYEHYHFSFLLACACIAELVNYLEVERECYMFSCMGYKCFLAVFKRAFEDKFEGEGGWNGLVTFCKRYKDVYVQKGVYKSLSKYLTFSDRDHRKRVRDLIKRCAILKDACFKINDYELSLIAKDEEFLMSAKQALLASSSSEDKYTTDMILVLNIESSADFESLSVSEIIADLESFQLYPKNDLKQSPDIETKVNLKSTSNIRSASDLEAADNDPTPNQELIDIGTNIDLDSHIEYEDKFVSLTDTDFKFRLKSYSCIAPELHCNISSDVDPVPDLESSLDVETVSDLDPLINESTTDIKLSSEFNDTDFNSFTEDESSITNLDSPSEDENSTDHDSFSQDKPCGDIDSFSQDKPCGDIDSFSQGKAYLNELSVNNCKIDIDSLFSANCKMGIDSLSNCNCKIDIDSLPNCNCKIDIDSLPNCNCKIDIDSLPNCNCKALINSLPENNCRIDLNSLSQNNCNTDRNSLSENNCRIDTNSPLLEDNCNTDINSLAQNKSSTDRNLLPDDNCRIYYDSWSKDKCKIDIDSLSIDNCKMHINSLIEDNCRIDINYLSRNNCSKNCKVLSQNNCNTDRNSLSEDASIMNLNSLSQNTSSMGVNLSQDTSSTDRILLFHDTSSTDGNLLSQNTSTNDVNLLSQDTSIAGNEQSSNSAYPAIKLMDSESYSVSDPSIVSDSHLNESARLSDSNPVTTERYVDDDSPWKEINEQMWKRACHNCNLRCFEYARSLFKKHLYSSLITTLPSVSIFEN